MNWDNQNITIGLIAFCLILIRYGFEFWLDRINTRHVINNSKTVPDSFKEVMDESTYKKSVDYTLTKSRFGTIVDTYSTIILIIILFSGFIGKAFTSFTEILGESEIASATSIFIIIWTLQLLNLPFSWHSQFKIEEKFGFNNSTQKTWWSDQVKGLILSFIIGVPLLWVIIWTANSGGDLWWIWVWVIVVAFQLIMTIVAPIFILPIFNKFTPLPDGELKDRLNQLASKTGFINAGIQVMDGSRRSSHSNAFFTGLGKGRKIALFDTLIDQLQEDELEAVLAHEIGHYKLKHVPKMIIWSFGLTLAGLYFLSLIAQQPEFIKTFGFASEGHGLAPAFILFALLSSNITFWLTPISSYCSRKFEYQADKFAANVVESKTPMIKALRKLNQKNLSNLTPHPLYSGFHYDHPTLIERESALRN